MSLSRRDRNLIIGGIVAAILIGLLAFFLGRSCAEERSTTVSTSTGEASTAPVTPTATAPAPEPEPVQAPEPEPVPAPEPVAEYPVIVDQVVDNLLAHPGDTLIFTAQVQGTAARVYVAIGGSSGGNYAAELAPVASAGGVTTWSGSWSVPPAPDTEIYYARAAAEATDGTVAQYDGGGLSASQMPINVVP